MRSNDEENQRRIWNGYADRGFLQATIDPQDKKGRKRRYIDRWSRLHLRPYPPARHPAAVLGIGCGSGRNPFLLASFLTSRRIRETFTDTVFICEPT